jgi:hypothetical protein
VGEDPWQLSVKAFVWSVGNAGPVGIKKQRRGTRRSVAVENFSSGKYALRGSGGSDKNAVR